MSPDLQKQFDLAVQEKTLAIEKWNQSKLVIDKLEEEITNLRESTSFYDKNTVHSLKQEYSEAVRMLEEKVKTLQEQVKELTSNSTKKGAQILLLQNENEGLKKKCDNLERECSKHHYMFLQARDEYILLESKILNSSTILQYNEKKRNYVKLLEEERDELAKCVKKLSQDCSEMETALEICHRKIEECLSEQSKMRKCTDDTLEEKQQLLSQKSQLTVEVQHLKDTALKMKEEERDRIKKEIEQIKQKYNDYIHNLLQSFDQINAPNVPIESGIDHSEYFDEEICNKRTKILVLSIKKKLSAYSIERSELTAELLSLKRKLEKCVEYIEEMNSRATIMKNKITLLQHQLDQRDENTTVLKTNKELDKHIRINEQLYKKWKDEVEELIKKFKLRISCLMKNLNKAVREKEQLELFVKKYITCNST